MASCFYKPGKLTVFALAVLFFFSCNEKKEATIENHEPVAWSFVAEKKQNDIFEVKAIAELQSGWHIYSQSTPAGGPVPTHLRFQQNPLIKFIGDVREEGKREQHYEPLFEVDVFQFSHKVAFVQDVQVRSAATTRLSGSVRFMACNSQQCLPAKELPFSVVLKN